MTDAFFPTNAPSQHEIRLILLIRYMANPPRGDRFTVETYNTELHEMDGEQIELPYYYYEHLRRFLWRHQALMEVYSRHKTIHITPELHTLFQRYIVYMDAMIEGLLAPAREQDDHKRTVRSSLFDLYLAVENLIGRHQYDVGDQWRLEHPDIILECVDVESLGGCQKMLVVSLCMPVPRLVKLLQTM
jgi:hypothetical protein